MKKTFESETTNGSEVTCTVTKEEALVQFSGHHFISFVFGPKQSREAKDFAKALRSVKNVIVHE